MKYIPAILSILLLTTTACSSSDSTQHTQPLIVADTVSLDTITADTVASIPDSVLASDASTTDQAIAFMDASPDAEAYRSGILYQMAQDNPDYCIRLLKSRYPYFIVVDKPSMFVVLYDRLGREKFAFRMACSKRYGTKHKRRDNRTPEGFFSAEGIYDSTDWLYTNDDGYTSPVKGQFGPRFIRLKTDVTRQVGIHGTCAPGSLGRRASHGCIRIHNDNIIELVKYVTPGTPIIVNPSERDQQINRAEGYTVPSINIGRPTETVSKPLSDEAIDNMLKADSIANATADSLTVAPDSIIETPASTPVTPDTTAAVQPAPDTTAVTL